MSEAQTTLNFSAPVPVKYPPAVKDTGWTRAVAGMEQSYDASSEDYRVAAMDAIFRACKDLALLTAEDVWERFPEGLEQRNGSALGHMMRQAKKNGWIASTGATRPGRRPTMHCKPERVWKSLIYNR